SDQPFDRGSIWGTVNLPPTGSPAESATRATREPRRSRWRREPLEARDIMTRDVKSVHPDTSLRDAVRIMRDQNTGIVPVVNADDVLQGVVTDRDIVMRSVAEGKNPTQLTAADVMTHDIDATTPDESVVDVVRLMGTRQVRRVPVVDQNDRLVGIISMADIATRADYDPELQDALEEISLRRSFWRE
ncbi:MAG TPA: CBS domain-containing protein, partial [Gemmatimonadaceae bacterium]